MDKIKIKNKQKLNIIKSRIIALANDYPLFSSNKSSRSEWATKAHSFLREIAISLEEIEL